MIQYYSQLQIKILSRQLKSFGLNPILGLIFGPIFFVLLSWFIFQKLAFSEFIYPLIPIYIIHMSGNHLKTRFLKSYFSSRQCTMISLVQNISITVPFIIFILYKQEFTIAAILFLMPIVLAILNPVLRCQTKIPSPFSKIPFEFPIGFRKSLLIYSVAFIILIISIQVENFNLGIVVLGMTLLIPLGFYSYIEPKYYVMIFNDNPSQFLWRKIKTGLLFSMFFSLPVSIFLSIWYPSVYLIIIAVNVIGLILLLISIIAKYSSYPKSMSIADSIMLAISILIPPLLLITIPRLYKKSVIQLKPILG